MIKIENLSIEIILDLLEKENFDIIFQKTFNKNEIENPFKEFLITFEKSSNKFFKYDYLTLKYSGINKDTLIKYINEYIEQNNIYINQNGFYILKDKKIHLTKFEIFYKKRKIYSFQEKKENEINILNEKKEKFKIFIENKHSNHFFLYNKQIDNKKIDIISINKSNNKIIAFIFVKHTTYNFLVNEFKKLNKYFNEIYFILLDKNDDKNIKEIPFIGIYKINGKIEFLKEATYFKINKKYYLSFLSKEDLILLEKNINNYEFFFKNIINEKILFEFIYKYFELQLIKNKKYPEKIEKLFKNYDFSY